MQNHMSISDMKYKEISDYLSNSLFLVFIQRIFQWLQNEF